MPHCEFTISEDDIDSIPCPIFSPSPQLHDQVVARKISDDAYEPYDTVRAVSHILANVQVSSLNGCSG